MIPKKQWVTPVMRVIEVKKTSLPLLEKKVRSKHKQAFVY
jgi:hypothetical protein